MFLESILQEIYDQNLEDQQVTLGIDEAGRGPVLGPLVYGAFLCRRRDWNILKNSIGVAGIKEYIIETKDSKTLTKDARENIIQQLNETKNNNKYGWMLDIITAQTISHKMQQTGKESLNDLSHNSTIGLISNILKLNVPVRQVFVDTVGPSLTYQNKLQKLFPHLEITVAEKADSIYPVVSAASIVAKVTRDRLLAAWEPPRYLTNELMSPNSKNIPLTIPMLDVISTDYNDATRENCLSNTENGIEATQNTSSMKNPIDMSSVDGIELDKKKRWLLPMNLGSGYTSDPLTKDFLQRSFDPIFGFPNIVRFSWSTARTIIERDGVAVDWHDDEISQTNQKQSKLNHFFTSRKTANAGVRDPKCMKRRCIESVFDLNELK